MTFAKSMAVSVAAALALACANGTAAQARTQPVQARASMGASAEPPGCEKAVKDYLGAVRFIKEASGTGIAGRVEQAYLNEGEVTQIASQQGFCAAAQALRNKGAAVR
jgi:hypothetical protein